MAMYKISPELAQEFVDIVYQSTGFPATVCDENAVMIGDSLRKRIGTVHGGAKKILSGEVTEYFVTAEEAEKNTAVKEGYNVPVVFEGERIGTTGIGGKIEITKPLVMMTARIISARIKEEVQKDKLEEIMREVSQQVGITAASIEKIAASFQQVIVTAEELAALAGESDKKVRATAEILHLIKSIAGQSKMLSLNAAIEAARAGVQGRGFAVVASEMQTLSLNSADTTAKIDSILKEIQQANQQVIQGMGSLTGAFDEQKTRLADIVEVGKEMEASTQKMVAAFQ